MAHRWRSTTVALRYGSRGPNGYGVAAEYGNGFSNLSCPRIRPFPRRYRRISRNHGAPDTSTSSTVPHTVGAIAPTRDRRRRANARHDGERGKVWPGGHVIRLKGLAADRETQAESKTVGRAEAGTFVLRAATTPSLPPAEYPPSVRPPARSPAPTHVPSPAVFSPFATRRFSFHVDRSRRAHGPRLSSKTQCLHRQTETTTYQQYFSFSPSSPTILSPGHSVKIRIS